MMTTPDSPHPSIPRSLHPSRRGVLGAGAAAGVLGAAWSVGGLAPAAADPASELEFPPMVPVHRLNPAGLKALLDYDPEKDPLAKYARSRVPLAPRIAPRADTQANPDIDPRPEVLHIDRQHSELAKDPNFETPLTNASYGYDTEVGMTRQHSYVDYLCNWNGGWHLPALPLVDRAHRNGVLALGVVINPYMTYDETDEVDFLLRDEDGRFVVGDKLVDNAAWFGFDGYFLNIEAHHISPERALLLNEMFVKMRDRAHALGISTWYTQIYDSRTDDGRLAYQDRFDEENSGWIETGGVDSTFINYAWPLNFPEGGWAHPGVDHVQISVDEAERIGVDPFEVLHFGMEYQLAGRGRHAVCLDAYAEEVIPLNGTGTPRGSFALFVTIDTILRLARRNTGDIQLVGKRNAIAEEESKFWSGPSTDPSVQPEPIIDVDVEATMKPEYDPVYGVANFIAERSPLGSLPFVTRFNIGQGDRMVIDGKEISDRPWYNGSNQDLLPTWQWWTSRIDGGDGARVTARIREEHAWNGPSSLQLTAPEGAGGTEIHLFKTDLDVSGGTWISVLVKEVSRAAARSLGVRLTLADGARSTSTKDIPLSSLAQSSSAGEGWTRYAGPLAPHLKGSSRRVAAIGLTVTDPAPGWEAVIGEFSLAAKAGEKAAAPKNVQVEDVRVVEGSGIVAVHWDLDPQAWYYDVHRTQGGETVWAGRTSTEGFIAGDVPLGEVTFSVTTISRTGATSRATSATTTVG